jgi:DNA-directed RNA polymerase sigma subunit (sigma70/sigma32)
LKIEDDFREPYVAWQQARSPETAGALLRAVNPVLDSAVQAFAPAGGPVVRSHAKRLALEAFDRYDPARGRLKPHLMSHLQGLQRIAGRMNAPIRLPERVAIDRLRLEDAERELSDELGRPPSDGELAARAGLTLKRLAGVRKARLAVAPEAFDSVSGEDGEEAGSDPAVTKLGPDPGQAQWVEFVYDSLAPTDQYVMERLLGLHGHRPASPAALARELRVTPGALSQRTARIQQLLDRRDELAPF